LNAIPPTSSAAAEPFSHTSPPARAAWLSFATTDAGLDALVVLFGLWTLCCHVTVLSHGNGWMLFGLFAAALLLGSGLAIWRSVRAPRAAAPAEPQPALPLAPAETSARSIQPVGLVLAGLVVATWWYQHDGTRFWWATVAFFCASAVYLLWRPPPPPTAADERLPERIALFLLALFGGVVAACLNTPNSDDVLYVNIAVAVADNPGRELYAADTIHGGGMVLFAAYAVHSFELLAGLITRVTGIPAINVIHLIFGPIAGFLIAYAWARLLRLLEPSRWIWLVAIIIAYFVLDGTSERSIVGHAFIRLFQGKAVLLTVHLPLLSAYAIEYVQRPSLRSWLLLTAAIVGGVGLSSTGLWLVPAVAGTALLVPLVWRASYWKTFALGLLPCLYSVALGLRVRALMASTDPIASSAVEAAADVPVASVKDMFWGMLNNTFMHPRLTVVYLVCGVLAWPLARTVLARRYLVAFSLIGVAFLLNPALYELVSNYVAGHATHGRVMWYLPITLAFAICVAAAIEARPGRGWQLIGGALACVLLFQFSRHAPVRSAFALAPPTFPPALKIYDDGFDVARFLAHTLPPESMVLAPPGVSLALPMVQNHPYALMTKPKFFAADSDGGHRFRLRRVIDGKQTSLAGRQRTWFRTSLDSYKVNAVVVPIGVEPIRGLTPTLQELGFKRIRAMNGVGVWTRPLR
jgi:hypothetical protein